MWYSFVTVIVREYHIYPIESMFPIRSPPSTWVLFGDSHVNSCAVIIKCTWWIFMWSCGSVTWWLAGGTMTWSLWCLVTDHYQWNMAKICMFLANSPIWGCFHFFDLSHWLAVWTMGVSWQSWIACMLGQHSLMFSLNRSTLSCHVGMHCSSNSVNVVGLFVCWNHISSFPCCCISHHRLWNCAGSWALLDI